MEKTTEATIVYMVPMLHLLDPSSFVGVPEYSPLFIATIPSYSRCIPGIRRLSYLYPTDMHYTSWSTQRAYPMLNTKQDCC